MDKFLINEVVYTGDSYQNALASARVKLYDQANNYIELIAIHGRIQSGETITGKDSGYVKTLGIFTLMEVGGGIPWDTTDMIVTDTGSLVALDEYFTGFDSQDYQQDNIISIQQETL